MPERLLGGLRLGVARREGVPLRGAAGQVLCAWGSRSDQARCLLSPTDRRRFLGAARDLSPPPPAPATRLCLCRKALRGWHRHRRPCVGGGPGGWPCVGGGPGGWLGRHARRAPRTQGRYAPVGRRSRSSGLASRDGSCLSRPSAGAEAVGGTIPLGCCIIIPRPPGERLVYQTTPGGTTTQCQHEMEMVWCASTRQTRRGVNTHTHTHTHTGGARQETVRARAPIPVQSAIEKEPHNADPVSCLVSGGDRGGNCLQGVGVAGRQGLRGVKVWGGGTCAALLPPPLCGGGGHPASRGTPRFSESDPSQPGSGLERRMWGGLPCREAL